ncbi:hypothetical protein WICPIJ_005436 [Wickerhamomyces pijperi]|uniref:Zinc-regulated transporter 2 n=1 Tax=Wickerhamomyces pijperi TaxID=599730 RepID=A0A9P8Q656_WICPI|nr:hypothetical protein WICPIJ_005436 [Wickerhamomyces pijperi]
MPAIDTLTKLSVIILKRDDDDSDATPQCATSNDYNGSDNLRILSLFMILLSSMIGTFFPILSSRYSFVRLPDWCWFIGKFFGSGVIIATGFIHLLQPANEALNDDCLGPVWTGYPFAFAICLVSLFVLFFSEIVAHYFVAKATGSLIDVSSTAMADDDSIDDKDLEKGSAAADGDAAAVPGISAQQPGANHYSHDKSHTDPQTGSAAAAAKTQRESYLNQILSVFVLEFGVVFHSVFIGLSLAVAGDEFKTLFVVLIFHQMFEGLGLGTRIAETPWEQDRKYTPWLLAAGYCISTPIAVGIGIGVRHSFVPDGRGALIANGCFDSISSGILIYTGIVELMAHEFLYSNQFKTQNGFKKMLLAYGIMCVGAGLMALLGKWA